MLLSQVELAAFELSTAWGKSFDVQIDQGESVLTIELRNLMIELHSRVIRKKKELSDLQIQRIAKAQGRGKKLGRPVIELPLDEIRKRLLKTPDDEKAKKMKDIAKEYGVHKITIARKLKEIEKGWFDSENRRKLRKV